MSSRSRSRSPIRSIEEDQSIDDDIDTESRNMPTNKMKFKCQISLTNIPLTWNVEDVKRYIIGTVKSKHVTEHMLFVSFKRSRVSKSNNELFVKFTDKEAAEEACEQLKDVEMDGKKLCPKMLPIPPKKEMNFKPNTMMKKISTHVGYKDVKPFQAKFSKKTYGLNLEFLQNLGISPPLSSKIFISNLSPKVDEKKLEEVFGLAGKIINRYLMRSSDGTPKGMATVTYDHPVEAVQAISMFNHQSLFGSQLLIRLDMKQNINIIPAGLSDIGPGLGENGNPLQYVRAQIEIDQIKQDIRDLMNTNNKMNQTMNMSTNLGNSNRMANCQNDGAALSSQILNPLNFSNIANRDLIATPGIQTLLQEWMQKNNLLNTLNDQIILQSIPNFAANISNQSIPNFAANISNQSLPNFAVNIANQSIPNFAANIAKQSLPNFAANIANQSIPNFASNIPNQSTRSNQSCQLQGNQPANVPQLQNTAGPPQGGANQQRIQGTMHKCEQAQKGNLKQRLCFTCRQTGHEARDCPDKRCDICNSVSHAAVHCWRKSGESSRQQHQMSGATRPVSPGQSNNGGMRIKHDEHDTSRKKFSDMVVFRNLPPSVTFEALNNKMREVGEVIFSELTARGKAIVRFSMSHEAQKCVSLFHRSRVDGQVIDVQYV